jgi:hypothetical protein
MFDISVVELELEMPSPHNTQKLRKRKVGCQDIAGTIIGRLPHASWTITPSLSFGQHSLFLNFAITLQHIYCMMIVQRSQHHLFDINYDR